MRNFWISSITTSKNLSQICQATPSPLSASAMKDFTTPSDIYNFSNKTLTTIPSPLITSLTSTTLTIFSVSQLVQKSRAQFRKEKDISEDKYIFYIDAGNNANEVKFSYKAFKDGFNKFFEDSSISHINKDHF